MLFSTLKVKILEVKTAGEHKAISRVSRLRQQEVGINSQKQRTLDLKSCQGIWLCSGHCSYLSLGVPVNKIHAYALL